MKLYHIERKAFLQIIRASYSAINLEVFDNELPNIPIRLTNTMDRGFDGMFTVRMQTQTYYNTKRERKQYQIEYPYIEIGLHNAYWGNCDKLSCFIDLLAHEMIHVFCYLHGIRDCDETQYHNYNFLEVAEQHGMFCTNWDQHCGFTDVYMSDNQFYRIIDRIPEETWKIVRGSIKKASA